MMLLLIFVLKINLKKIFFPFPAVMYGDFQWKCIAAANFQPFSPTIFPIKYGFTLMVHSINLY